MNKLILFLFPFSFKYNDYEKFELNFIENSTDVYVCELLDYLHKNFSNTYPNRSEKKNILQIKNKKQISNFFDKIISNYNQKNIYIINYVDNTNIKSLLFNLSIRKKFKNIITITAPGIKTYSYVDRKLNLFKFIKEIMKKNKKLLFFNLKVKIYKYFYNLMLDKKKYEYALVAGKHFKKTISLNKRKKIHIIDFNSWDYSKTLNYSAIVNSDLKNSVVFLDVPNPNYLSENNLYGIKNTLVANEWFKQLNNFFIFLENKLKKKVIICSHPLTPVDEDYRHQFNSYKISENETMQTIYNSDLVVSVGSTALSYALIYKKPLLLIYNEPIKKSTKFNTLKKLSEELDCKILNIENEDYKNSDWNEIYDFNINKYKNYVNNYLSENFQNKSNSQIISNLVNNNESK